MRTDTSYITRDFLYQKNLFCEKLLKCTTPGELRYYIILLKEYTSYYESVLTFFEDLDLPEKVKAGSFQDSSTCLMDCRNERVIRVRVTFEMLNKKYEIELLKEFWVGDVISVTVFVDGIIKYLLNQTLSIEGDGDNSEINTLNVIIIKMNKRN